MKEAVKFGFSPPSELPSSEKSQNLTREEKKLVDHLSVTLKQDLQRYLDSFQEKFYLNHLHPKKDYIIASVAQELNLEHGVITGIDLSKFSDQDIKLIDHMAKGLHDKLLKKDKLDVMTNYGDSQAQEKVIKSSLIQVLKDLGYEIK
jgi:hypothetical protein